jgi:hypothetical protein
MALWCYGVMALRRYGVILLWRYAIMRLCGYDVTLIFKLRDNLADNKTRVGFSGIVV